MKTQRLYLTIATVLTAAGILFCQPTALYAQSASPAAKAATAPSSDAYAVEITATDYAFRAPDEISSGWTTLRFKNEGAEPHFVFPSRLPEGKTAEDYETELSLVFNDAWTALRDGELEQEEALGRLFESLPEWFPSLQFIGGPGFAAPGLTSETTVHLEPGNYVLECYLKTEDGEFHYMEGMMRPLVVTAENSGAAAPESDLKVTLSNYEMAIEGEMTPGRRTIEVHVAENPEEGFGHSAHLARLKPETDVTEVVQWMNAFGVNGLRTPAPVEFIGGTHMQMPIGQPQYFTVDVEPGRYLFISEATAPQGVWQEVTVEP